jgi:hypothetical protein
MSIRAGYFTNKHLFTSSQKKRLESLGEELNKETLNLEEIRKISKTFIDRGSRKTRVDFKAVKNNMILWALAYPLAIAQIGIKSLDYLSLLRYKSPVKTSKLNFENKKQLEVLNLILLNLDRIISLSKKTKKSEDILTLEGIKHELIHELRPLFLKEKKADRAKKFVESVLKDLHLTHTEEIKDIISSINHPNKKSFEEIQKSLKIYKKSLRLYHQFLKDDNRKPIAEHLQNLDRLFGDLELFVTDDISTKALLLNGSSHLFCYYLLGIPGPKLSALTSKEKATKTTKKLSEDEIKKITKENLQILDLLYKLQDSIEKTKKDDPKQGLRYKLENLITKIELNIYPLKNINQEYEKFILSEITSLETNHKERLRELISINNPKKLLEYIKSKSPDLFSQIIFTSLLFNVNGSIEDNSEKLMQTFDDKILKDKKNGEFIIDPKLLANFKKEYFKITPSLLKNIILLMFLAQTARNEKLTRRDFAKKIYMGSLNYMGANQFGAIINKLPDRTFKIIKYALKKRLLVDLEKNKISNEKKKQILSNFEAENEISKNFLELIILNTGFPVLFGAYGYDQPNYITKNSNRVNEKIDEFIEILKNIIEIQAKKP